MLLRVLLEDVYARNLPSWAHEFLQLYHGQLNLQTDNVRPNFHYYRGFLDQKRRSIPSHWDFLSLLGIYCRVCYQHDHCSRWQLSFPCHWKRMQWAYRRIMGRMLLFHYRRIQDLLLSLRCSSSSCPLYLYSLHLFLHGGGQKERRRWLWQSSLRLWSTKNWLLSWS